jgi:hypothetical protein
MSDSTWVHNASTEVNDSSQYPTILAVCIVLTAIMCATIGLRGYVRAVMLKTVGADDWTILFAGVSFSAKNQHQFLTILTNSTCRCVASYIVDSRLGVSYFARRYGAEH